MLAGSCHIPFVADYDTLGAVAYEFDVTKCAEIAEESDSGCQRLNNMQNNYGMLHVRHGKLRQ